MDGPRAGSSAWVEILLEIELDGLRKVGDSFQLELLKKGAELLKAKTKFMSISDFLEVRLNQRWAKPYPKFSLNAVKRPNMPPDVPA